MKKLITMALLLVSMTAGAQEIQFNAEGCYEVKKVVTAENMTASDLYTKALVSLSDWAGSQQKTKANVDVQDKEQGLVVYKGQIYLGYGKQNALYGWDTYADFTLKVRCKEGKAQLTIVVPSLSYYWTADNTEYSAPISEILPEYHHKAKMLVKKASIALAPKVPEEVEKTITTIGNKMTAVEDDF